MAPVESPLWVVIPTYNEVDNVAPMAEALLALPLPQLALLFVDDASPDGTGAQLDVLVARHVGRVAVLHRQGLRGLGRAYVDGFRYVLAQGAQAVVQMDCDFSHQPQDVPRLFAALDEADLVIGSRYVSGGATDPDWGVGRQLLSSWANFYARFILGFRIQDATAGFRAWRSATLQGIGLERILSQGYVFQVEMTYVAHKLGYKIEEIPIFFPDRRIGQSKMTIPVKIEAALRVWEVRWRHRRLNPQARRQP
ncbi:MAG TPA: polyprenol monophosphomannose synthase [Chloroflexi bacterium]|nr:polyprenol monophosphomannose synthase [Chloroflexota bacterium]